MPGRDLRYLLHLWFEHDGDLQASVRNVADGELRLFAGLRDLVTFLEASARVDSPERLAIDDIHEAGGDTK